MILKKGKDGKEKQVPWMQCMNADDFAIHATNVRAMEDAQKGLLGIIDRHNAEVNKSVVTAPCPWYKRIFGCKQRSGIK